jgi:hypothetical protein
MHEARLARQASDQENARRRSQRGRSWATEIWSLRTSAHDPIQLHLASFQVLAGKGKTRTHTTLGGRNLLTSSRAENVYGGVGAGLETNEENAGRIAFKQNDPQCGPKDLTNETLLLNYPPG